MDTLTCYIIFFIGLIFGSVFNRVGNILSNDKSYNYNICKNCKHNIGIFHISFFSYLFHLGKCKYCKSKLSLFPVIIEISTGALYLISYLRFFKTDPSILYIIYSILFVSSLIIIIVSDIDYMIIPDEVIVFFSVAIVIVKLLVGNYNEEYKNLMDVGYEILFLLYDGFILFFIMYLIKKMGDFIFKRDSMGGGDIKLMFYISMVLGWKLSIVVIFLAAFLALPVSIVKMLKNNQVMLAFGPYLAIASLILFLSKIDINVLIKYLT